MGRAFRIEHYVDFPTLDAAEMAATVRQYSPATDADALKLLRAQFAHSPLSLRVAALDILMRGRSRRDLHRAIR